MSRSPPHPGRMGSSFPLHLDTGDQNATQRFSLWPRTTSKFPAISGPSKTKTTSTDWHRCIKTYKVTQSNPGSLCHICNKLALWVLSPPTLWVFLGCLRVSIKKAIFKMTIWRRQGEAFILTKTKRRMFTEGATPSQTVRCILL